LSTKKNNIKKIREKLPNIPIIIENVPYPYKDINWFLYPEKISEYCNKYDLGMILDIAHQGGHAVAVPNEEPKEEDNQIPEVPFAID